MSSSFGSFGSFGSMGTSLGNDSISIEYFSGQPNPQLLPSELISVVKNLMRKDVTTRERGAREMLKIVPSVEITDVVHLAWIQLYVKLCIDDAASVRAASHQILGEIYKKLGKASTKYLKDSLPCLFLGFYDQVPSVQQAAKTTFEGLFSQEKRKIVLDKFGTDIAEFCSNIVLVQSPQTLSDERYVSKQESALKYERVLRQSLDVVSETLLNIMDDISLLRESKLWKLMVFEPVAKNVLNLAAKVVKKESDVTDMVLKQLNKAMQTPYPSSSVELVRTLLVYQKSGKNVSTQALAGFIKGSAVFPKQFWPLFFNLAILVGFNSPLKEALASVAIKVAGITKDEVWGAFLALCARFDQGDLATNTIFSRCKQGRIDVSERFSKLSPNKALVQSLLASSTDDQLLNFALVLAGSGHFKSEVEPQLSRLSLAQIAELVKVEPELDLSSIDLAGGDPHVLAAIASHSTTVDAKAIAEGIPEDILLQYPKLSERGVSVELGDLTEPQALLKAALSRSLVGDATAAKYIQQLATENHLDELTELARRDPQFLQASLNNDIGTALLDQIDGHDELVDVLRGNDSVEAVLRDLRGESPLDNILDRAVSLCNPSPLPELLPQLSLEDFWPHDASIYPVAWQVGAPTSWEATLRTATYLVNIVRLVQFPESALVSTNVSLALVAEACKSIEFTSTDDSTIALASALAEDARNVEVEEQSLLSLLKDNDASAFYAAQILYHRRQGKPNNDLLASCRSVKSPAIVWALIAKLHAGQDAHWYAREQTMLSAKASTLNEFACVDSNSQGYAAMIERLSEASEPLLQWVVKAMLEQGSELSNHFIEHALASSSNSQRLVLGQISPHTYDAQVAKAASSLVLSSSMQSQETEQAFLSYCRQLLTIDMGPLVTSPENWLDFCLARQYTINNYKKNAAIPAIENLATQMLYIDIVGAAQEHQQQSQKKQAPLSSLFSDYSKVNDDILQYVQQHIQSTTSFQLEEAVGTDAASYLLLKMCQFFGGSVRQWYRSITDKTLRAQVDTALQRVVPEIMKNVAQESDLTGTTVSQKAREIRSMIDIDETVAQIVITLDPLFPVKNSSVQLIDLAGVPEHKRRSWALEAEHTVQNGQVVAAMRTLRLKLEQFLEGIEPCSICYSVMLGKSLPSKSCSTCKNTYHSDCLYQWFNSNKDKLCPMCRTPF